MSSKGGASRKKIEGDQNLIKTTKTRSGLSFEIPLAQNQSISPQHNLNETINIGRRSTLTPRSPVRDNLSFSDILSKAVKSLSPNKKANNIISQEQIDNDNLYENIPLTDQPETSQKNIRQLTDTGINKPSLSLNQTGTPRLDNLSTSQNEIKTSQQNFASPNQEEKNCIMADSLSKTTQNLMKKVPKITSDSSSEEIANWVDIMKEIGGCVDETEHQIFIKLVRLDLGQVIRDITLKHNFGNIQEFAEFIQKKFGSSTSIEGELQDMQNLRRRVGESYTRFGARILSSAHKIIEKINATFEETTAEGQRVLIETIALKIFLNSITEMKICARMGTPKDLMTAIEMASELESEIYGDRPISRLELKVALPESVNAIKKKVKQCQGCNKSNHEFLECPEKACIFCGDTAHLSHRCSIVPEELKVNFTCKICNKKGHTISTCDSSEGGYCQICQLANHDVDQCGTRIIRYCHICRQLAHRQGEECLAVASVAQQQMKQQQNQQQQDSQQQLNQPGNKAGMQGLCFSCNRPGHIARYCRAGINRGQFQRRNGRGRGNQNNWGQQLAQQIPQIILQQPGFMQQERQNLFQHFNPYVQQPFQQPSSLPIPFQQPLAWHQQVQQPQLQLQAWQPQNMDLTRNSSFNQGGQMNQEGRVAAGSTGLKALLPPLGVEEGGN